MILHDFPDLVWLRKQADEHFSAGRGWNGQILPQAGWPSVILHVKTGGTLRDHIRGPLSLFTNLSGESHVETGRQRAMIKEGFCFITNPGQHYTLDITKPANTFNIHFGELFAEQVFQAIMHRPEALLDQGATLPLKELAFHNRLHPRTGAMEQIIQSIYHDQSTGLVLEERLATLMTLLLQQETMLHRSAGELPVLRSATREEILKRLALATDYIYTFYHRDLSLDELATAACLSKFHFLRLFKIMFSETPHQFINRIRIERSRTLLKQQHLDIKTIARAVGFNASSSFSRAFYQHVGVYPTEFQQG